MGGSRPCAIPISSDPPEPAKGVVETCDPEGQALGTASVSAFPGRYGKGPHVERSGNLPRRAASGRGHQRAPGAVLVRAQREREPADQQAGRPSGGAGLPGRSGTGQCHQGPGRLDPNEAPDGDRGGREAAAAPGADHRRPAGDTRSDRRRAGPVRRDPGPAQQPRRASVHVGTRLEPRLDLGGDLAGGSVGPGGVRGCRQPVRRRPRCTG